MNDPSLNSAEFVDRVRALELRIGELHDDLVRAEAELRWYKDGLNLFGPASPGSASVAGVGRVPKPAVTPYEAVLRVISESREREMQAKDIIAEVKARGWMPEGAFPENNLRNRLRLAVQKGDLVKTGHGRYALPGHDATQTLHNDPIKEH